jgi:iron complex transport system substrate-binding protein
MLTASRRILAVLGVACLFAASCGDSGQPASDRTAPAARFPVTVVDDEGVEITIPREPQRIITFAPSHTEIIFALGLEDRLVGVSGPFDDFPLEAQHIEEVGGAGEFGVDPNEERVVELEPDLMLTAFIGGEWKDRFRELGIPVFTTLAADFEDALADIVIVGRLTGAVTEAAALTDSMRTEANQISASVAEEEGVTCFFEVGFNGGFFTVGPGALEYELLQRAGCDPVTSEATDPYPQWSVEQLIEDDPDVYLVAEESGGSVGAVGKRDGFDSLSSVKQGRVFLIDSDLVSRPGPRMVEGLRAFAETLHPEALAA